MLSALVVSNFVLWVVVIGLALVVFALVRQIGVLHERVAPAGALMVGGGPKVGDMAPLLRVEDLQGSALQVGAASTGGRSLLLFFLSPTCPVCKTLLPVLRSIKRAERGWLDVVLASDGDFQAHKSFVEAAGLEDFSYVLSAELGMSLHVGRLPYAVLIDELGVIRSKGLINSREHLESLLEAMEQGVASIQEYVQQHHDNKDVA